MCIKGGIIRRVSITAILIAIACLTVTHAFAWEFKMKGECEWRFRYWGRTGQNDIFGTMNGNPANLGVNHLATWPARETQPEVNSWNKPTDGFTNFGVMAGEHNFGSDLSSTEIRCTLYPTIKVNKAIKIAAGMNLTSLGIWSDGEPLAGTPSGGFPHPGAYTNVGYANSLYLPISSRAAGVDIPNTYVTLQWLKWSVKTPMVDLSIGYKNSKLGMGLWKHASNRASASFGVKAHYGPLTIEFSPYFSRRNSDWRAGKYGNGTPSNSHGRGRDVGEDAPWRKEHVRDRNEE